MADIKELPKLPHGMGDYTYVKDKIRFRKSITINGQSKRLSVTGSTITEVNKLMKEKENVFIRQAKIINANTSMFQDNMKAWLELYKKGSVSDRSYDRNESIFNNHIKDSSLGQIQDDAITSDQIQIFLKQLTKANGKGALSYSSKKKVYELLNQYFNYKYVMLPSDNPMLVIKPPVKENNTANEELIILNDDEIKEYCKEAYSPYINGVSGYKHGVLFVFILWTFMRIGEVLALQWKDIDFKNETVKISKSYSCIKDRDENNSNKTKWIISKTKNRETRNVKMCKMALDAIKKYKEQKQPQSEDEFILANDKGKILTITSLDRMNKNILSHTEINKSITLHGLRHTGISYFIRNNVPVEVVSRLAGHSSIKITLDIYYSVIEEQKIKAVDELSSLKAIDFET